MSYPAPLVPWVEERFLKMSSGVLVPNDSGYLYFYEAGSLVTLQDTYSDSDLTTANANPIQLDADGLPTNPIFLQAKAYQVKVTDSASVTLYTKDNVADPGFIALQYASWHATEGSTATGAGPYIVLATDNLVQVSTVTTPFVVQLPAATARGIPLIVKNLSAAVSVRVTPAGADTIDTVAAYYTVPAAVSPLMPSIELLSDGVSNWVIRAGLGI